MGKPGRIQDPDVRDAIRSVAAACAARKVAVGIFAAGLAASAQALEEGYTLVCSGIDVGLYSESAAAILRGLKPRSP